MLTSGSVLSRGEALRLLEKEAEIVRVLVSDFKRDLTGMLVGGPNSGLNDPYVQNVLKGVASAKCYADNAQSYSTNEITIYWNSPLIYLLAAEISETN